MIKGVTTSGFAYEIKEEALNDYEILEQLREVDKGDLAAIVDVVNTLLSEEQKNALKDHLRGEDGRVGMKEMIQEVAEILQSNQEGKNS